MRTRRSAAPYRRHRTAVTMWFTQQLEPAFTSATRDRQQWQERRHGSCSGHPKDRPSCGWRYDADSGLLHASLGMRCSSTPIPPKATLRSQSAANEPLGPLDRVRPVKGSNGRLFDRGARGPLFFDDLACRGFRLPLLRRRLAALAEAHRRVRSCRHKSGVGSALRRGLAVVRVRAR